MYSEIAFVSRNYNLSYDISTHIKHRPQLANKEAFHANYRIEPFAQTPPLMAALAVPG